MAKNDFAAIDEQRFHWFHWRVVLTTGLGAFCDGYDLSSIGLVLPYVLTSMGVTQMSSPQSGLLAASALLGAGVGAIAFGLLGQKGRKRFYGLDMMIMGVAALAQAFVPSLPWLIFIRFVLGIGVGADYVLSPMIMAEHANRPDRGRALGIGFSTMWQLGALAAGLFKLALDGLDVAPDLQWRLVLAVGAIPAFGVLYFRRRMPETVRFLARLAGDPEKAASVIQQISGVRVTAPAVDARPFMKVFSCHARVIFSAAALWMVYDLVIYGGILFGPSLIAQSLGFGPVTFVLLIQFVFLLPAGVLSSYFVIDRIGRKPLQIWGFAASAVFLTAFAFMRAELTELPVLAFVVYGLFGVAQMGPGLVSGSGLLGVELAPTRIRSVGQSITVTGGRIGAAISAFAFPLLFASVGEAGAIFALACLAIVGALLTKVLIPETKQKSLEEISDDAF